LTLLSVCTFPGCQRASNVGERLPGRRSRNQTLSFRQHLSARQVRALRRLREEDSWTSGSGRSSKTVAKYPDFRIVLVLMKADSEMKDHHADARISIQTIQGRVRVHLPDQAIKLGGGELMCLESGIPHDVKALEESAFLYNSLLAWRKCRGAACDELNTASASSIRQRALSWRGVRQFEERCRAWSSQKLRRRNSCACASTFSCIVRSGNRRAISIAPIIVEKIAKKARSLSAIRRPGMNDTIRLL
jgi:quercetin dioxygenase-like cupin family protein